MGFLFWSFRDSLILQPKRLRSSSNHPPSSPPRNRKKGKKVGDLNKNTDKLGMRNGVRHNQAAHSGGAMIGGGSLEEREMERWTMIKRCLDAFKLET